MPKPSLFEVDEFFDNTKKGLRCKTCHKHFKTYKNSNLRYHLENTHQMFFRKEKIKPCPKSSVVRCSVRKNILLQSCIALVTDEGVPIEALSSEHMKNILDAICERINEQKGQTYRFVPESCEQSLAQVARNVVKDISSECANRIISLKVERFTISAQFIKDDVIVSRLLGLIGSSGTNVGKYKDLPTEIVRILQKYNINLQQIISITTDNVHNILRPFAFKLPTSNREEELREEIEENYNNEMYFQNIDEISKCTRLEVGDITISPCSAQMAQMAMLDTSKDREIKKYIWNCRNLVKFLRRTSNGYTDLFKFKSLKLPELDCPSQWGTTYSMVLDINKAKEIVDTVKSETSKSMEENFEVNQDFWNFINSYCVAMEPLQKAIATFKEQQMNYGDFYVNWLQCKLLVQKKVEESSQNKSSLLYKISLALLENIKRRNKALFANSALSACLHLHPRFHHLLPEKQRNEAVDYLKDLWVKLEGVKNACFSLPVTEDSFVISQDMGDKAAVSVNSGDIGLETIKKKDDESKHLDTPVNFETITTEELIIKTEKMEENESDIEDGRLANETVQMDVEAAGEERVLRTFVQRKYFTEDRNIPNQRETISTKLGNIKIAFIKYLIDILAYWKERKHNDPEIYALSNICFGIPAAQAENRSHLFYPKSACNGETMENLLLIKYNPDFVAKSILELDPSFSLIKSLDAETSSQLSVNNFIKKVFVTK